MDIEKISQQYIAIAEDLFGPMCSEWKYIGTEFNDMGPHLRYYPDERSVAISLSEKARNDEIQLHFQLSHEVCHLLYPTTCVETNNQEKTSTLNEGVSTYFSILAIKQFGVTTGIIENLRDYSPNYYDALALTYQLIEADNQAILKLRSVQPQLNKIEAQDFENAGLDISEELKSNLLSTFS
jgi:hypothetical protein